MTPEIPVSKLEIKVKPSELRVLTIDAASSFAAGELDEGQVELHALPSTAVLSLSPDLTLYLKSSLLQI